MLIQRWEIPDGVLLSGRRGYFLCLGAKNIPHLQVTYDPQNGDDLTITEHVLCSGHNMGSPMTPVSVDLLPPAVQAALSKLQSEE